MSKADAQRAMREARYLRLRASGPTRREEAAAQAEASGTGGAVEPVASAPRKRAPSSRTSAPTSAPDVVPAGAAPAAALCGHRSMNGRTCTREAGHAEKNHRYG